MVTRMRYKSGYRRRDGTVVKAHVQKYSYRDFVKLRLKKLLAQQKGKKDTASAFKQMGKEWKTAKTMNEADVKKNYGYNPFSRYKPLPSQGVPFGKSTQQTTQHVPKEALEFRRLAAEIEQINPGSKNAEMYRRAATNVEDERRSLLALKLQREAKEQANLGRISPLLAPSLSRKQELKAIGEQKERMLLQKEGIIPKTKFKKELYLPNR